MGNIKVRVLVAMVVAVFASIAVPVTAQRADWDPALKWEVASPEGTQVAFVRRDDRGRVYYWVTMVYQGGQRPFGTEPGQKAMKRYYYAANCPEGLFFQYEEYNKTWTQPRGADEVRGTTPGIGYKYVCEKYGPRK